MLFLILAMKNHFLKLFDYDRYANKLLYEEIIKAGSPFKAKQTMAHLLTAQQIWLNRCMGLPPVAGTLWISEDKNIRISSEWVEDNHKTWSAYINRLEDADFDSIIAYKNLSGVHYSNLLLDICTHVINHGTHHRAQIGQHLKAAGIENLPLTDFIAFVR
jgi:uncharacterized damage-inducible protein DinB